MKIKRLKTGDSAPEFSVQLWDGSDLKSEALRGKKTWLAFFRYASCPLCNLRVHQMIKQYETFQKFGLNVIAVFQSPKESISEYVGLQKPPFPLVSDPDEKLYGLYGLDTSLAAFLHPGNLPLFKEALGLGFRPGRMEGSKTRVPADFLIDSNGVVQYAFYGDKIGDHVPLEVVMKFAMGEGLAG